MGVPAFYRWLSQKYPLTVKDVIEEEAGVVNGVKVPVDTSGTNPNGVEFDNLYLDMNGIIHPCFHPEDRPPPTTEDEVFDNIFRYIDRLFAIARPRRLLYMAIDGVAPRAKMNQQRARRFRAAQEREEREAEEQRIRSEMAAQGISAPPKVTNTETFDSNIITPGTPFMARLSAALQYYVHARLNADPGWRGVKVVLSDANVPGEGEHKIMAFIRLQRGLPGYDPNTRHCMYGLDADLIMLALATHEPHFAILREVVMQANARSDQCYICGQPGHRAAECQGKPKEKQGAFDEKAAATPAGAPYQLLHVSVLRDYLQLDLAPAAPLPFSADLERALDDFVFLCFFVGNDFLPHMPTLEIREGAIDLLVHVYKQLLPDLGGYLTDGPEVHLARVERFIQAVGAHEDAIFQKRARTLRRQRNNRARDRERDAYRARAGGAAPATGRLSDRAPLVSSFVVVGGEGQGGGGSSAHPPPPPPVPPTLSNKSAAEALREQLLSKRVRVETPSAVVTPDDPAVVGSPAKRCRIGDHVGAEGTVVEPPAEAALPPSGAEGAAAAFWSHLTGGGDDATPAGDVIAVAAAGAVDEDDDNGDGGAPAAPPEPKEESHPGDSRERAAAVRAAERLVAADDKAAADGIKAKVDAAMKAKGDRIDAPESDGVRLGESGWKERYYADKLHVPAGQGAAVRAVLARKYVEGLCWVMRYYYQGVCSWTWFFPFHYAPFASDLVGLAAMDIRFDPGKPFKPFDQLMGVLPAASSHALPAPYAALMTDPSSAIADFYPREFALDMNGKRFAWQAVVLLPFIDETRLLACTAALEPLLTPEERRRNGRLSDLLFVFSAHPLAPVIYALEDRLAGLPPGPARAAPQPIPPALAGSLNGGLCLGDGPACPPTIRSPVGSLPDVVANQVLCCVFRNPPWRLVPARLLEGVCLPARAITDSDLQPPPRLWHEDQLGRGGGGGSGGWPNGGFQGNGRGYNGDMNAGAAAPGPGLASGALRMLEQSVAMARTGGMQWAPGGPLGYGGHGPYQIGPPAAGTYFGAGTPQFVGSYGGPGAPYGAPGMAVGGYGFVPAGMPLGYDRLLSAQALGQQPLGPYAPPSSVHSQFVRPPQFALPHPPQSGSSGGAPPAGGGGNPYALLAPRPPSNGGGAGRGRGR